MYLWFNFEFQNTLKRFGKFKFALSFSTWVLTKIWVPQNPINKQIFLPKVSFTRLKTIKVVAMLQVYQHQHISVVAEGNEHSEDVTTISDQFLQSNENIKKIF